MDDRIEELSSFLSVDLKVQDCGSVILKKSICNSSNHQHYIKVLSHLINSYLVPGLKTTSRIETTHEVGAWMSEVQSFLTELGIPLCLSGTVLDGEKKLSLLSWIVEEIQCLRLSTFAQSDHANNGKSREDELRGLLKASCLSLSLSKPPANLAPKTFFQKLTQSFLDKSSPLSASSVPIISQKLSPAQWETLESLKNELNEEYSIRWVMLLARLDSTIQSFTWSNRLDDKKKLLVEDTYALLKRDLVRRPNVSLGDLLAASQTSLRFEKLSSSKNKSSSDSSFAKVRMGRVPDRGGRPRETPAPPPESWQQQHNNNNRGRGGHQNRGGRGGSNHQENRHRQYHTSGGYGGNQGFDNKFDAHSRYAQNPQGYNQGYRQGYSQSHQGYGQSYQGNSQDFYGQGQQHSQGSERGNYQHGRGGGGYQRRGRDNGDHQGKKRRVQDNRF